MLSHNAFNQLLATFGTAIGITGLTFDTDGQCNFTVKGTIPLVLKRHEDSESLTVLCPLEEELPSTINTGWVKRVLEFALNPARQDPGIGFVPASNSLVLHHTLPLAALDSNKLQRMIADVVDMRMQWPEMLSAKAEQPASFGQHAWIRKGSIANQR